MLRFHFRKFLNMAPGARLEGLDFEIAQRFNAFLTIGL